MVRLVRALLLALVLSLVLAPAAQGARWSIPVTFADSPRYADTSDVRVAINSRGESVVVWHGPGGRVLVAFGSKTGKFSKPLPLPQRSPTDVRGLASSTQVAIADSGEAVAAWADRSGVVAAVRRPHRRFGSSVRISDGRENAGDVLVVIDSAGTATVAWFRYCFPVKCLSGGVVPQQLRVAIRSPRRGFGSPQTLASGYMLNRTAATDTNDQTALAWIAARDNRLTAQDFFFSVLRPGWSFGEPLRQADTAFRGIAVALGPGGKLAAGWRSRGGRLGVTLLEANGRLEASSFAPTRSAVNPAIAFGPRDELIAVWQARVSVSAAGVLPESPAQESGPVQYSVRPPGGTFAPARTLGGSSAREPMLASTRSGRAVLVWSERRFRAAVYRAGTGFESTRAPRGKPNRNHYANANRDLAAAGRFAVVGWEQRGYVRVSVGRF
jgi:hypothetical protein